MSRLKLGMETIGDSSQSAETEITIYAKINDFDGLRQADVMLQQAQSGISGQNGKIRVRAETRDGHTVYTETIKVKTENDGDQLHGMDEMTAEIGKEYFDCFVRMVGSCTVKDRYDFKVKKFEGLAVGDGGIELDPNLMWFSVDTFKTPEGAYKQWCKIDLEIDELLNHQAEHGDGKPINLKLRISGLPFKPTEAFLAKEATPEQQAIVDDLWGNKK